jgi:hypothetical protein
MNKIVSAEALANYCVKLTFTTGESGTIDLSHLVGKGVFARWREEEAFRRLEVGPNGDLRWDDEIDLCPDALYMQVTGKTIEELFPNLRHEGVDA